MAKNAVNGNGAVARAAELETALANAHAAVAELETQAATLATEKAQLEAAAKKSLAGVALGKLRSQAAKQAEQEVQAKALALTLEEVGRRLDEARNEVTRAERAVGVARVAAAQAVITEQETRAAELLRQAADLLADNAAQARAAAYREPGERGKTMPELLLDAAAIEAVLARYGEAYATKRGAPAPVMWKRPTTAGLQPAPAYRG